MKLCQLYLKQISATIGQEDFFVVLSGATAKDKEERGKKYVLVRRNKCELLAKHIMFKSVACISTYPNEELLTEMNDVEPKKMG